MSGNIDIAEIDEAVLALFYLMLHKHNRVWKSFECDTLHRLHEPGLIDDPVNHAKSVVLIDKGLRESERYLRNTLPLPPKAGNNSTNFQLMTVGHLEKPPRVWQDVGNSNLT